MKQVLLDILKSIGIFGVLVIAFLWSAFSLAVCLAGPQEPWQIYVVIIPMAILIIGGIYSNVKKK